MKRVVTGPGASNPLHAVFEKRTDGPQLVSLSGAIDENADLGGVFSQLTGDTILNMRGVERVNSMGVHHWIPIATAFAAKHRLYIDEISYAFVQNANVVANLFGAARVRSCMAPYYCASCKKNYTLPVTDKEVADAGDAPPPKLCERCNAALDFDELDGYFSFFKRAVR